MLRRSLLAISAAVVCVNSGLASAGDLNPPAGPVASTMKTLTEVEPRTPVQWLAASVSATYVIDTPGSYYLIGNIIAETGKHGIEITTDNVTLDLRGFVMLGSFDAGSGIYASVDPLRNISVYNGVVEGWAIAGVDLNSATNCRVERILANFNSATGIRTGNSSAIVDCHAMNTGGSGIRTGDLCVVRGCTAQGNGDGGIRTGGQCSVSGCSAANNTYGGIFVSVSSAIHNCTARSNSGAPAARGSGGGGGSGSGFQLDDSCTIANSAADLNASDGISGGSGCTVANCASRSNSGAGIGLFDNANITHCSVTQNNWIGIWVSGGTISDCTSSRNGSAGISSFFQPLSVSRTETSYNGADGIFLDYGGRAEGCTASENGYDGIRVADDSVVLNNKCTGNGTNLPSGGVRATGARNRIDGNNVTAQDRGIIINGSENVVIHNSAGGNSVNYDIAGGNDVGPIGSAATLTSPWGNISFGTPVPTCLDGIQNGAETDTDCGGGTCPPCGLGQGCAAGSDCASGICSGGICQLP